MCVVFVFVHPTTAQFSIRKKKKKKKRCSTVFCHIQLTLHVNCVIKKEKKKGGWVGDFFFFFFFFALKMIYFSHNNNNKTLVLKFGVRSTMDLNNEVLFLSQISHNFKTWDWLFHGCVFDGPKICSLLLAH